MNKREGGKGKVVYFAFFFFFFFFMIVNDHLVYHGVTEIEPIDASLPAWRDVLVLTFHKQR